MPMGEFWVPSPHRPKPENRFFVKQAASAAAHLRETAGRRGGVHLHMPATGGRFVEVREAKFRP
jgi:hypothetical protein